MELHRPVREAELGARRTQPSAQSYSTCAAQELVQTMSSGHAQVTRVAVPSITHMLFEPVGYKEISRDLKAR